MPTPVAALLNSPEITFNRDRNGANGCRHLPSSMSAPVPLAHQCGGQIPLPMNSTAKRFGAVAEEAPSLAKNGIDSSHGRAIVTPMPLSIVRRLGLFACGFIMLFPSRARVGRRILSPSFVPKLRTHDNRFHQAAECVSIGCQLRAHVVERLLIREQHTTPQRVGKQ